MTTSPPPPIPDRAEILCASCHRFKPRAAIAQAEWMMTGPNQRHRQARYRCRSCADELERRRGR